MPGERPVLARAVSDEFDRLIAAEEPLAGLQLRCGGELPGEIAVPALLELVRKARTFRFRLARRILAQDGDEAVTAWIEVTPRDGEDGGCDIAVSSWQSAPLPEADPGELLQRRQETDRQVSELTARLDSTQRVLAVMSDANDLEALAEAMQAGIGQPWTDFVTIDGGTHRQPLHWRLLDGAGLRVDGSERHWQATLIPLGIPGGEPEGFELLLHSQEPPPRRLATPAPEKPGSIRRGLVGEELAPILRQPISRIIANAETIRTRLAGPLSDAYAGYAADIAAAGQHLMGLLEDLSDLEVVESEGFSTHPDDIDLAEVARKAAGILAVRAKERNIVIDAPKVGETLPATAEFRRVLQILLNLIGNAIRYAPEESHVWIRLEELDNRSRITVADQGPGLSEEQAAIVFDKFQRLGRSGDGGSGLGLYISRRLARAMQGELSVESAPGQGARFVLDLPPGRDVFAVEGDEAAQP